MISGNRAYTRRGSALMVALALLMMLAVFAALFLTSSRYDQDASTAALDYVRMDLYAEGLSQYVQTCLVVGLWGFDDKPRNYDGNPLTPGMPLTNMPGPDAPFDYYGGGVSASVSGHDYYPSFWLTDPRVQSVADTNPGISGNNLRMMHSAFVPVGLPRLTLSTGGAGTEMPSLPPFWDSGYGTSLPLQWRFADLDGDGRADTPWLFIKPLGNGLYVRAAVRVEDASSRINVNVADMPLQADANLGMAADRAAANAYEQDFTATSSVPLYSNEESRLRKTIYGGYPWIGAASVAGGSTLRNSLMMSASSWIEGEFVGRYLSEMNLMGSVGSWLGVVGAGIHSSDLFHDPALEPDYLKLGMVDGGYGTHNPTRTPNPNLPGVYGRQTSTSAVWRFPGSIYDPSTTPAVVPALAGEIGDPSTGNPGRFGSLLAANILGSSSAGAFWDFASTTNWRTFDPEATGRVLSGASAVASDETDRPLGTDEAFDLMNVYGQTVWNGATGQQRYRAGGGWPTMTRLKQLWRDLVATDTDLWSVQWRKILTSYSWTLDCCPYGEDPYTVVPQAGSYRKVNLNAVPNNPQASNPLYEAFQAADRHPTITGGATLTGDQLSQYIANFYTYRAKQMTASDLAYYLRARLEALKGSKPTTPPASNIAWNEAAWQAIAGATPPIELAYLSDTAAGGLFSKWPGTPFWAQIRAIMETNTAAGYVSNVRPQDFAYNGLYGQCRQPFITEVYMDIGFPKNVTLPTGPTSADGKSVDYDDTRPAGGSNNYALELYNPWDTYIYLQDWYIEVSTATKSGGYFRVSLGDAAAPFIRPHSRFVVSMNAGATITDANGTVVAPDFADPSAQLILASQGYNPAGGPTINLVYRPGGGASRAVYDNVPTEWTREFSGDALGYGNDNIDPPAGPAGAHSADLPGLAATRAIVRRDDSGFWCYQRWAEERKPATSSIPGANTNTLGSPNYWYDASGNSIGTISVAAASTDPWDVTSVAGPGPNPAVPVIGVGQLLSPAELLLIPYDVPMQTSGGSKTFADGITPYMRATDGMVAPPVATGEIPTGSLRYKLIGWDSSTPPVPSRPMLFNRSYTNTAQDATTGRYYNAIVSQAGNFASTFQSLMDFVTVADFTQDGVNNATGAAGDVGTTTAMTSEMRVPGRLNVNTVSDWWSLSQLDLLVNMPRSWNPEVMPTANELEIAFWRRLLEYRDLRDPYYDSMGVGNHWYPSGLNSRRTAVGSSVRDATVAGEENLYLGFERQGDLCNVQRQGASGGIDSQVFEGLWQNHVSGGEPYLGGTFWQTSLRRFARNFNLLSTRSDTYMVTIRVEIIRPYPALDYLGDPAATLPSLSRIDSLGQREYMYLVDRSYCTRAPQQQMPGLNGWGPNGAAISNPDYTGRVRPDFIPPRVWRMSIPSYVAH